MSERRTGRIWVGADAGSKPLDHSVAYEIIETDEFVMGLREAYTRRGAERAKDQHVQAIPSYHLRVERLTRNPFVFGRWAVNAYQNRLVPAEM